MSFLSRALTLLLVMTLSLPSASLALANDDWIRQTFGESVSVRGSRSCAIVHSPKRQGRVNDSAGYPISTRNLSELRESLKALKEAGEAEGRLSLANLPMWSRESKEFLREVRGVVAELGLQGSMDVKAHYVPTRTGILGALEKMRYFLPMKQDYEKPIPEEVWAGVPGTAAAEATSAAYSLMAFPPEISGPMLASHFALLFTITAYRRTMSNWINRSGSMAESFAKQSLLSGVFVTNYKLTANWQEIYRTVTEKGMDGTMDALSRSTAQFAVDQGATTLIQTVFFWLTFNRGVFRWEAIVSQSPDLSVSSRKAAALMTPLIFSVSGPMVMWASTSTTTAVDLGFMQLNPGQLGLLALAAGGGAIAYKPERLNATIPFFERFFYQPFNRAQGKVRDWLNPYWLSPLPEKDDFYREPSREK